MLNGIPAIISPDLLKILDEMGHGDTIVIGDAHFATEALAEGGNGHKAKVVRADGQNAAHLLDSILRLMPLDSWAEHPVIELGIADGKGGFMIGNAVEECMKVVQEHDASAYEKAQIVDRMDFYDLTRKAYAIVATGEADHYGCILLQKGVCSVT